MVPDESTVRKLVRRLGAEVVEEMTRLVIDEGQAGDALPGARGEDRLDRRRDATFAIRLMRCSRFKACGCWRVRAGNSRG